MAMHTCNVSGVTVRYRAFGEGRPLLMLHGYRADHRVVMRMCEPLFAVRSGWRRIYPDLPGMGQTPAHPSLASHDDVLKVVTGFIDTLAPDERLTLGGVSYGGYLALGVVYHMAQRLDGLMLVVPSVERDPAKQRLPAHRVLAYDSAFDTLLQPEEAWLRGAVVVQTPAVLEQVRAELLPALALADAAFIERLNQRPGFSFDPTQLRVPFDAPALILTGRQDSVTGYREAWAVSEQFPRGSFVVLDRAGHMLHREQTVLFRALMSDWLDRVQDDAMPHAQNERRAV